MDLMLIDLLESSKAIGLCPMGTLRFISQNEDILSFFLYIVNFEQLGTSLSKVPIITKPCLIPIFGLDSYPPIRPIKLPVLRE